MLAACDPALLPGADPPPGAADDGDGGDGGGDGGGGSGGGPSVALSFAGSNADLINPERGYYRGVDLLTASDPARVRNAGSSLAIAIVRLDAYRTSAIDPAFLGRLRAGLTSARTAGIKVILRFTYNASLGADASRTQILAHITQLQPLLQDHGDVIAVVQAGFIGAWGEWHASTNGLDNTTDRTTILNALLAALPADRAVQIRTPMFKDAAFPGGPLIGAEAWTGTARARLGHHNDCFLASASDMGTYASPVAEWRDYVAQDSAFTPVGGETCAVNPPRTSCAAATAELAALAYSYLNVEYHQSVLAAWDSEGCGGDVRKRLGYRLTATGGTVTAAMAPGGELALSLDLANAGYAAPFNPRPAYLVLRGGGQRYVARLASVDVRAWRRGTRTISTVLRLPAAATAGVYRLGLWLPDARTTLRDDPRYAIRLANDGTWDAATGENVLTDALAIDPMAPGGIDPTATQFVEL